MIPMSDSSFVVMAERRATKLQLQQLDWLWAVVTKAYCKIKFTSMIKADSKNYMDVLKAI